jgi:cation transport ATPase
MLARKTLGKIRINVLLSMALNFAAITLAFLGLLGPVAGAQVHNAGSVLVVINSALLLGAKEPSAADLAGRQAGRRGAHE